ncbi:MAG TPA: pyridoxamine 5'-phosphate oxidase [Ferruginibacter sp.]|nr:pyridoxamine 5'-phosphate oxidase [Ferruginibacter sp.]
MNSIADIRKDYKLKTLSELEIEASPIAQFSKWWHEAIDSRIEEVNAMTLATSTTQGKPSARIVLLKGYNDHGFNFFTNYESHKGEELAINPQASLVFFWKELERQVRIEGIAEKLDTKDNDAYFLSRPTGSQIGAWASPQSQVIKQREEIEKNVKKYELEFANININRPAYWGGYRVKPQLIEFWQGRPNRLHDRIQYSLEATGKWKIERLAP